MKVPNLLLTLLLLASSSACLRLDLTCASCKTSGTCPSGLECVDGVCIEKGDDPQENKRAVDACYRRRDAAVPPVTVGDGGADSTSPLADGPALVDADPTFDTGSGLVPDGAAAYTCTDRCCIGNECLAFTPRVQAGLLLWLDRTTLGAPGTRLERWRDRSPNQTDVVAVNADSPPRVQLDEVGPIAEIDEERMVLATERALERRLGFEDFVVYVLARCDARTGIGSLFYKSNATRPARDMNLYCNHDGAGVLQGLEPVPNRAIARIRNDDLVGGFAGIAVSTETYPPDTLHLYGARRVGKTRFQLRVDGKVQSEVPIPDTMNLDDNRPISVGSLRDDRPSPTTSFDGGIAAVVVVSGPLTDQEVADLEAFLLKTTAGLR